MLTLDELFALDPPGGLTDEELGEWWLKHLSEPDGSIIMRDDYGPTTDHVSAPDQPKS
ncbi:MAG TPA: hypothetical protein P5534_11915 [Candidatus Paceibacterota bacterium]|nr:hypothetical protein [Candidatus Paceibacterota bacterium]HRZ55542.1 hypothetical protein [Candidatus Paceibacterota bacterium]